MHLCLRPLLTTVTWLLTLMAAIVVQLGSERGRAQWLDCTNTDQQNLPGCSHRRRRGFGFPICTTHGLARDLRGSTVRIPLFLISGTTYLGQCMEIGWVETVGILECWGLGNGQTNQIRVTRRSTNHSRGIPLIVWAQCQCHNSRNQGRINRTIQYVSLHVNWW